MSHYYELYKDLSQGKKSNSRLWMEKKKKLGHCHKGHVGINVLEKRVFVPSLKNNYSYTLSQWTCKILGLRKEN